VEFLLQTRDLALRGDAEDNNVVREYVYDYGHGAVQVGDVSEDGAVELR